MALLLKYRIRKALRRLPECPPPPPNAKQDPDAEMREEDR